MIHKPFTETSLQEALTRGESFFDQAKVLFVVRLPADLQTHEISLIFQARAYELIDACLFMVLDLSAFLPPVLEETWDSRPIDHCLDAWMPPLVEVFDSTEKVATHYQQADGRGVKQGYGLHHFSRKIMNL